MADKIRPLYKSTITIWSTFDAGTVELSQLAREAEEGMAYASHFRPTYVADPSQDPDFTTGAAEFFDDGFLEPDEDPS